MFFRNKTKNEPKNDTGNDAPLKEILFYALGNIESGFANQFQALLPQLLIIVMTVNPLLIGMVIAIKYVWDGITDPIMAHISDNAKTRWGRRIPFIFSGAVLRMFLIIFFVMFIPHGDMRLSNKYLETDKTVSSANKRLNYAEQVLESAYYTGQPLQEEGLSAIRNRLLPFLAPSPEKQVRTQLDEVQRILTQIQDKLPQTIAVLETNIEEKKIWRDDVDPSTETGEKLKNKRNLVVADVEKRLHQAQDLLDETAAVNLLQTAATDQLAGCLSSAVKRDAETATLRLKREKLQKLADLLPPREARWEQEVVRLENDTSGELSDTRRQQYLQNARGRVESARQLRGEISTAIERCDQALANPDALDGSPARWVIAVNDIERISAETARLTPPGLKPEYVSGLKKVRDGWNAFQDPANAGQRKVVLYLLILFLVFTSLTTVQNVPYYALGMELCSSYDGRTRVAIYRSMVDKITGLLRPWMLVFCLMPLFKDAFGGLLWVVIFAAAIGIPCTSLMCFNVKERTRIASRKKPMPLLKSIKTVMSSRYFWRVFLIYQTIGLTWSFLNQYGLFLNVYWVMGSASGGAKLTGIVQTMAWALSFAVLPLINWGSRRFQKHNVIQVAVILMSVGAFIQWWAVSKTHPYLQLVLPFFTSVGISSFYVIMASMMADVTDADELKYGQRREGMYAAVMSFVGKMVGTISPMLSMFMLQVAGFDQTLEYNQMESTITIMRLLYSFVPGVMILFTLVLLWKYPLNRKRMIEIKDELKRRHDAENDLTAAEEARAHAEASS